MSGNGLNATRIVLMVVSIAVAATWGQRYATAEEPESGFTRHAPVDDFADALQIYFAIKTTRQPVRDALGQFADGPIEKSALPSAFGAISKSIQDSEARLQQQWPETLIVPRLGCVTYVIPVVDLGPDDAHENLEMNETAIRALLERLVREHPAEAKRVSLDSFAVNKQSLREARSTLRGWWPWPAEFDFVLSGHMRIKDVEQTQPRDRTVSMRIVYEVLQKNSGEGESPVASLETVKHDFVFDGEKWVPSREGKPKEANPGDQKSD